jgi:predicted RND superfamily exporter protein
MSDKSAFLTRGLAAYAHLVVAHPGKVLALLLALGAGATWLTTQLTLESDQLSLISQDLPEVKGVKRIIDMVGGAGYLQVGLRSNSPDTLKKVSDAMAEVLEAAKQPDGTPWVRFLTYKVPIEFVQENMVLFIRTEDLIEGKKRINAYLKDQLRRNNPFFIELRKTEPVKLDLSDLIEKYSSIGKKSIRDDYYLSNDKQMLMFLIKPMWNSTVLPKTQAFIDEMTGGAKAGTVLTKGLLFEAAKKAGVELVEDYELMGDDKRVAFGFTGSYKTNVDDSVAMMESLDDITFVALGLISLIIALFFRRVAPTLLVLSGTVLGTVYTLGFAKLTLGQLNMVTSIIAAILLGFGIDYGIHFTYRSRIELGSGKPWDIAIRDAIINAGRPALIAAIVTAGSFFVLLVSEFRGFSQFGFLAGFGTLLIAATLFSWTPAILSLAGRRNPEWPKRLIGVMPPPSQDMASGKTRIPAPKLLLGLSSALVLGVCAFAVPWVDFELPKGRELTMLERLKGGVRFNYNTRALQPVDQPSVKLQDEINRRFQISSDPIAVYTRTVEEAKDIWDAMTHNPDYEFNVDTSRYPTVDQVVSIFTFTPPPKTAEANAKVLAEWQEELKDIDVASLPPDMQEHAAFFKRVLEKKPFDVHGVPDIYADLFKHLPTTKPENHGYLTFLYPKVDLWDGKNLMAFADETRLIEGKSGAKYESAGLAIVYSKLARIVLFDGKLTVLLAGLWILLMHYLDFRSWKLALASVLPLGVGLVMMLGVLSITNHRLNFMNLVILPILLGFGVSHGLYLLHRFLEGTSPMVALRSVGGAVASSTLTTIAGFGSLFFAEHLGLRSIGYVACIGLGTTLLVSFTVLAAILQLIYDRQGASRLGDEAAPPS